MPIVPNLAVRDLPRSLAFYTTVLGMKVTMTVDGDQNYSQTETLPGSVFATLELDGSMLMLQQLDSLADEVPMLATARPVEPDCTIYFRDVDADEVAARLDGDAIVTAPKVQWYGMREVLFRDPDGHVICAGKAVARDA